MPAKISNTKLQRIARRICEKEEYTSIAKKEDVSLATIGRINQAMNGVINAQSKNFAERLEKIEHKVAAHQKKDTQGFTALFNALEENLKALQKDVEAIRKLL